MCENKRFIEQPNHFRNKTITGGEPCLTPIGYCHIETHPGYLNPQLMKKHKCIKKACPFLEKNMEHPAWQKKKSKPDYKKKLARILHRYYLINRLKSSTYKKLLRHLNRCRSNNDLIKFCNYLEEKRGIDVPEELYYAILPSGPSIEEQDESFVKAIDMFSDDFMEDGRASQNNT